MKILLFFILLNLLSITNAVASEKLMHIPYISCVGIDNNGYTQHFLEDINTNKLHVNNNIYTINEYLKYGTINTNIFLHSYYNDFFYVELVYSKESFKSATAYLIKASNDKAIYFVNLSCHEIED